MDAPTDYKNAGLANIIGGALNVMMGLLLTVTFVWVFCIGLVWLVPTGLGAWQIMVGLKMYNGEPQAAAKNATIAGLVAGALNFNIISLVAGIFAFMMLGKPEVAGYLESNG